MGGAMSDKLTANFSRSEIACKDGCGASDIHPDLMDRLQEMRNRAGAIYINSGVRCRRHNREVGGSETSSHLHGEAVDIKCEGDSQRAVYLIAAIKVGFNRIGIAEDFIHLDITPEKAKPRIWLYPTK